MSICINNDLIWLSIPKCASTSIENSFLNSKLDIIHYNYGKEKHYNRHIHVKLSNLYRKFGVKDTVCINRDYFSKWFSSLRHVWDIYEKLNIPLIREWEEVDNDFIYKTFTDEFINKIYSHRKNFTNLQNGYENTLIDVKKILSISRQPPIFSNALFPENILRSQNFIKDSKKCTFEFNIEDLDKFEKFIENKYSIDFKLEKVNKTDYKNHKIIIDEKLKKWVWEKFEKRFIKKII